MVPQTPPCVTVNACPPTVIVPLRAAPSLARTENSTVPAPLPPDPDVIVIHSAPLVTDAVQAQPVSVVTVMGLSVPPVPVEVNVWPDGEIATVQPLACVAVNACPPAAIDAVRSGPVFAEAR